MTRKVLFSMAFLFGSFGFGGEAITRLSPAEAAGRVKVAENAKNSREESNKASQKAREAWAAYKNAPADKKAAAGSAYLNAKAEADKAKEKADKDAAQLAALDQAIAANQQAIGARKDGGGGGGGGGSSGGNRGGKPSSGGGSSPAMMALAGVAAVGMTAGLLAFAGKSMQSPTGSGVDAQVLALRRQLSQPSPLASQAEELNRQLDEKIAQRKSQIIDLSKVQLH